MNTAQHAFLFPGQGAQTVGMAVDLVAAFPSAREVYERAREIINEDILAICREGPVEVLNSTRVSQPAIFLHSMAVLAVLSSERKGASSAAAEVSRERAASSSTTTQAGPSYSGKEARCSGMAANSTAGLSLGEYSALVFAGCLSFEDALRIVVRRGEYMQSACDESEGRMASVLGLAVPTVEEVLAEMRETAAPGRIGISNYNSPDQTVISGDAAAVNMAVERLKEAGAKRAIPLRVAGAYHSELMAPATAKLAPLLAELPIRPPAVPFYSNVTGDQVSDPEEIRSCLLRQVESSVRWDSILRALVERGIAGAYELGPGRVLKGLMKSVARGIPVMPLGTAESLRDEHILCC